MADKGVGKTKMGIIKQKWAAVASLFSRSADTKSGNMVLAFIIIILINMVGSFLYFRVDLTLNNSYSLSKVSKETVRSLQEPLTIKVFFSENLPAPYNTVQRYLSDLMTEYDNAGGSNFRVERVDMESEAGKTMATQFDINPVQVREVASDQVSARSAYMGLVIIHGDVVEKMPEITNPEGLEYRITSSIRKMVSKTDALLKLKDPVKVTLYVSRPLQDFGLVGFDKIEGAVAAAVEKVKKNSFGKIVYNVQDPGTGKALTDLRMKYNLSAMSWKAVTLPNGKRVPEGEGVMCIVLESGTNSQVVNIQIAESMFGMAITGLQNIEERLNAAVGGVLASHTMVGYVVGHGERDLNDDRNGAGNMRKVMSDMYELKDVNLAQEDIPDGIKTLIVNGPKGMFSEIELFKIDQFMMQGGNVFFLVDAFNEVRTDNPFTPANYIPIETGLPRIIEPLGITLNSDVVLDKKCFVQRDRNQDLLLYHVPLVEKDSFSSKNVITKYLKKIIYILASSITFDEKVAKAKGLDAQVLVSSSDQAWKMQGQIMINPSMMTPPADKELAQYPMAILVEGKFKSVFNGVRPAEPVDPKKPAGTASKIATQQPLKESVRKGVVLVTTSSAITMFDPEGRSPDAAYFMNIIDYMNGNTSTQEMRSKGISYNPLDTTKAVTRDIIKFGNMFGVPLLGIGAGLLMWRKRAIRRKNIQAYFSKDGAQ